MHYSRTQPEYLMIFSVKVLGARNAHSGCMFVLTYAAWPLLAFVSQTETSAFHESMRYHVLWRSHCTWHRSGVSFSSCPSAFLSVRLLIVVITQGLRNHIREIVEGQLLPSYVAEGK